MAVVKYYPTEDRWADGAAEIRSTQKLLDSSRRIFFVLAAALNLERAIESDRLLRKFPDLRLNFVPMGSVLQPKEAQIVLDVGNRLETGMVDHHHIGDGGPRSSASLVWTRPELILDCPATQSLHNTTWITHEHPDFDAISSLFLAWHLARCGFFPPGADQLQQYALRVDMGDDLIEQAPFPERTPYALFMATLGTVAEIKQSQADHHERVRRAWGVITFLCQSEANGLHALAKNECPQEHGFWQLNLEDDEELFWRSDVRTAEANVDVQLSLGGRLDSLRLLAVKAPRSHLFKVWARRKGFPLTVVLWPTHEKPDDFVIISVPGAYRNALKGLGMALEAAEKAKRSTMTGKERPGPPRWPDVDNDDPWYDGRSAAHAFTIVASPRMGTVLTIPEILHIVKASNWHQLESTARA
jgi:hypothetical protein